MTTATHLEVGIVVRDLDLVTRFYEEGLGLPHLRDEETPYGLLRKFVCGPGVVKLMKLDQSVTESNPPGGLRAPSSGLRWISIAVDDLQQVFANCEAAGGRVIQPIYEWSPTAKLCTIEDPEGNCWFELAQVDRTR